MKVLHHHGHLAFSARFGCIADGCGTADASKTASAQDSHSIEIGAKRLATAKQAPAEHFTGSVQMSLFFPARDSSRAGRRWQGYLSKQVRGVHGIRIR